MSRLTTAQYVRFGHNREMARPRRFPPNRIRELREERGWSEAKLGALCVPPMTATQIDKREKGLTAVTMEDMHRIARALECHPGDLLPLPPVSAEERALVERYRELAAPGRHNWRSPCSPIISPTTMRHCDCTRASNGR